MAVTRSNIIAQPVDVYIRAATGSATLTISGCAVDGHAVGEGKIKFTTDIHEEPLADGVPAQIGVTAKLEIEMLEVDSTTLAALETYVTTTTGLVDIFLMQAGTAAGSNKTGWYFFGYGLTVAYEGVFSRKNANSIKLKAQKSFASASTSFTYASNITVS